MHHHIESLLCLDLVIFLVLNRIKPQAPLLVVPFCQFLQVSGLRPCSPQNHKTLISQLDPSWFGLRPFPCVKGLVFATRFQRPSKHARWDGKSFTNEAPRTQFWAESQWSEPVSALIATSKVCRACFLSTWNVFSFTQVAPRHRGTDCQIRWSVSVGSLLIITMASTLNGRINPTSQGCKNVAELLLQHLFGLGTDVDRPRRCAAAWKLKSRTHSRDNLTSNLSLRAHCRRSRGTTSGAVGTSTRADACALQAYIQLPAPSNHHLNSGISMSSSSINFWRLLCTSSRTLLSFWSMVPGISGLSQSKDTQHKVQRHQQIHLRTGHCHWHKPTKQTTSPLKFEPHMDRQCLIVCDPLNSRSWCSPHIPINHDLRKHKPTTQATCPILWVHAKVLIHHTRLSEILEVPYSKVSERRSQDEVQIPSVMVRILVYCAFLSPHCVRIK